MAIISEKKIYEQQVNSILTARDVDYILWGEDLYNSRIIIFPNKIKDIPGYDVINPDLTDAALVYLDRSKEKFIKTTIVRCDPEKEDIYIPEGNFNAIWKFLRGSIAFGIRIKRETKEEIHIKYPEDIVDLSLLTADGSKAYFDDGLLVHNCAPKIITEEELRARGRKQSLLDNPKNRYFYTTESRVYHDKDCECISTIMPGSFMASSVAPEGFRPCKKCGRRIFIREICYPNVKIIPAINHIMFNSGITNNQLEKIAFEYKLKVRYNSMDEITVKGKEDSWIIKGLENNRPVLWHNNYIKIGPHERCIAGGYHRQTKVDGHTLFSMFGYINGYSFEKHLEARKKAEQLAEQRKFEAFCTEENDRRTSIWGHIAIFVGKLLEIIKSITFTMIYQSC